MAALPSFYGGGGGNNSSALFQFKYLSINNDDQVDVDVGTSNDNVDENADLAKKYGIRGIPTMIFFKNGEAAKTLVGLQPKEEIKKSLEELE